MASIDTRHGGEIGSPKPKPERGDVGQHQQQHHNKAGEQFDDYRGHHPQTGGEFGSPKPKPERGAQDRSGGMEPRKDHAGDHVSEKPTGRLSPKNQHPAGEFNHPGLAPPDQPIGYHPPGTHGDPTMPRAGGGADLEGAGRGEGHGQGHGKGEKGHGQGHGQGHSQGPHLGGKHDDFGGKGDTGIGGGEKNASGSGRGAASRGGEIGGVGGGMGDGYGSGGFGGGAAGGIGGGSGEGA